MTGPEHYAKAEEMLAAAAEWPNADTGWKQHMSTEERLKRQELDLRAADIHARLAEVTVAAVGSPNRTAWMKAVFTQEETT